MTPPPKVLLVDDDAMVSSVVARILRLRTKDVTIRSDGLAALATLGAGPVDLVVSDLRMPGATGLEIAQWVQREGLSTEVLIITGFAHDADERAIAAAGARFLRKPFGAAELLRAVDDALERLAERRAAEPRS